MKYILWIVGIVGAIFLWSMFVTATCGSVDYKTPPEQRLRDVFWPRCW